MGKSESQSAIGNPIVACRRLYLGLEAIGDDPLAIGDDPLAPRLYVKIPRSPPTITILDESLIYIGHRTSASNRDNRRFYPRLGLRLKIIYVLFNGVKKSQD